MRDDSLRIELRRTGDRAELHVAGTVDWSGAELVRAYIASLCDMSFGILVVDLGAACVEEPALLSVMLASADDCETGGVPVIVRGETAA